MIAIVDYGVGNVASLLNMLDHIGFDACVTGDPDRIARSEHLILPGIGAFDHAMRELDSRSLIAPLQVAAAQGAHILGVCLGMQLLCQSSEEGVLPGLGLIAGRVVRLPTKGIDGTRLIVPNMGWHMLDKPKASPLFDDPARIERFYHVHSFHMLCDDPGDVVGTIVRGGDTVTVAVSHGSLHGVQFHPEKSHRHGMRVLKAFAEL